MLKMALPKLEEKRKATEKIHGCKEDMQRAGVTAKDARDGVRWRYLRLCPERSS